jgi:hypothetical protein
LAFRIPNHETIESMRVLFLLLALWTATQSLAQNRQVDIVYLKNGVRYSGEIIRYEQGKSLRFRQTDGVEVEINDADIQRITQGVAPANAVTELPKAPEPKPAPAEALKPRMKGLYNTTDISFGLGSGSSGGGLSIAAGLHTTVGYQFSRLFGLGAGFGLDNYSRRGETIYPAFAEVRSMFRNNKKSGNFFLSFAGGYGFAFERESLGIEQAEGGWMWYPAVGYRTATREGADVVFDMGLRFQEFFFVQTLGNGDVEIRSGVFQRTTIRIGMTLWKKK